MMFNYTVSHVFVVFHQFQIVVNLIRLVKLGWTRANFWGPYNLYFGQRVTLPQVLVFASALGPVGLVLRLPFH